MSLLSDEDTISSYSDPQGSVLPMVCPDYTDSILQVSDDLLSATTRPHVFASPAAQKALQLLFKEVKDPVSLYHAVADSIQLAFDTIPNDNSTRVVWTSDEQRMIASIDEVWKFLSVGIQDLWLQTTARCFFLFEIFRHFLNAFVEVETINETVRRGFISKRPKNYESRQAKGNATVTVITTILYHFKVPGYERRKYHRFEAAIRGLLQRKKVQLLVPSHNPMVLWNEFRRSAPTITQQPSSLNKYALALQLAFSGPRRSVFKKEAQYDNNNHPDLCEGWTRSCVPPGFDDTIQGLSGMDVLIFYAHFRNFSGANITIDREQFLAICRREISFHSWMRLDPKDYWTLCSGGKATADLLFSATSGGK